MRLGRYKVRPFALVSSGGRFWNEPPSLVQMCLQVSAESILSKVTSNDDLAKTTIETLPIVLIDMLEHRIITLAKAKYLRPKFNRVRVLIWNLFFSSNRPSESVRKLELTNFLIANDWSQIIFDQLSLSSTDETSKTIPCETLTLKGANCDNADLLESANFKLCQILTKCHRLTSIYLNGHFFDDEVLYLVAKCCGHTLVSIRISNNAKKMTDDEVTDDGISDFVDELLRIESRSNFLPLKVLNFGRCFSSAITATSLVHLHKLKSVKEFHFNLCFFAFANITLDMYQDLLREGIHFETVHLHFADSTFDKKIAEVDEKYLQTFFARATSFHIEDFAYEVKPTKYFKGFEKRVKSLSVIGAKNFDFWSKLCPNLERVSLRTAGLHSSWNSVALQHLRTFDIEDDVVGFDLVLQVLKLAKCLTSVKVVGSQFRGASDDKVEKTLRDAPHLKSSLKTLNLTCFESRINLTEVSLKLFTDHCVNLERIENVVYWQISAEALNNFVAKNSKLKFVFGVFLPNDVIQL